jgi:hypothetical protein
MCLLEPLIAFIGHADDEPRVRPRVFKVVDERTVNGKIKTLGAGAAAAVPAAGILRLDDAGDVRRLRY